MLSSFTAPRRNNSLNWCSRLATPQLRVYDPADSDKPMKSQVDSKVSETELTIVYLLQLRPDQLMWNIFQPLLHHIAIPDVTFMQEMTLLTNVP